MLRKRRYYQAIADAGPEPIVVNIDDATDSNMYFRSTLWTGDNLQVTLMSLKRNEEIGAEVHNDTDQFIKVESGRAKILIGRSAEEFYYQRIVDSDFAIIIPSGTWHNIVNVGTTDLKLYSVYAPPHHPKGTVHTTKEEAERT